MTMTATRWAMLVVWLVIGMAVLLSGCSKEYVPVAITPQKAALAPECKAPRERLPVLTPFPRDPGLLMQKCPGVESAIQCVNLLWAQHRVEIGAVVRRNRAREDVCRRFAERVVAAQ